MHAAELWRGGWSSGVRGMRRSHSSLCSREIGRWIGGRAAAELTEQVALACWWLLIYSSEMGLSFMGRGLLIAASKVGDLEWEMGWTLTSWAFLSI